MKFPSDERDPPQFVRRCRMSRRSRSSARAASGVRGGGSAGSSTDTASSARITSQVGTARTTQGLWARLCQRICALNAAIWHHWLIDAPVKRSLIAYDH
ncbi:hypothetical protein E1264_12735 [Actinomadura sp. KC216]|nr:hypothetical protein E1264_12735 [Actinomadura sp. KC216]